MNDDNNHRFTKADLSLLVRRPGFIHTASLATLDRRTKETSNDDPVGQDGKAINDDGDVDDVAAVQQHDQDEEVITDQSVTIVTGGADGEALWQSALRRRPLPRFDDIRFNPELYQYHRVATGTGTATATAGETRSPRYPRSLLRRRIRDRINAVSYAWGDATKARGDKEEEMKVEVVHDYEDSNDDDGDEDDDEHGHDPFGFDHEPEDEKSIFLPGSGGNVHMWVTHTISEDRSFGVEGLQNARLATLSSRFRYGPDADFDLLGSMTVKPATRDKDAFEIRLALYCRRDESTLEYECLVPGCTDGARVLYRSEEEWTTHLNRTHDEWLDDMKEEMGIPLTPLDESGIEAKDVELVQQQSTPCSWRNALKALIKEKGDIVNAIMGLTA